MSRLPCPSRWTFLVDLVVVSTSLVPNVPWLALYAQYWVLTPVLAGPLKESVQTCFQAGAPFPCFPWVAPPCCPAADEQLSPARTMSMPSPAISSRDQREACVRSLASYGLSARTAVRRHVPGHPARNPSGIQSLFCLLSAGAWPAPGSGCGDPPMPYCLGWRRILAERGSACPVRSRACG
jgi:hypothetical protein